MLVAGGTFGFNALGSSRGAEKKKGKPVGLPLRHSPATALGSLPSVALSSGRARESYHGNHGKKPEEFPKGSKRYGMREWKVSFQLQ